MTRHACTFPTLLLITTPPLAGSPGVPPERPRRPRSRWRLKPPWASVMRNGTMNGGAHPTNTMPQIGQGGSRGSAGCSWIGPSRCGHTMHCFLSKQQQRGSQRICNGASLCHACVSICERVRVRACVYAHWGAGHACVCTCRPTAGPCNNT